MSKKRKGGKNGKQATRLVDTPIGAMAVPELPPIEGPASAMVIVAHPDDADFGSAGTIAKWCAEGWEVRYVIVTGGDKGTHDPEMHPEKLAAIREEEQRAACRRLGVKECILLGYPDGFTQDDPELRGTIVRLLRRYRPDVVVTWDGFRGTFNHRDHRTVGIAVADAIYPLVRDRLFYPGHEEDGLPSHEVNNVLLIGSTNPDYTVDVTEHWETKIDAIFCHASQVGGRTREDFARVRREQQEREGPDAPILERFRRWSVGRQVPRPPAEGEVARVAKKGKKARKREAAGAAAS
jgi:LmbE family N-acetylglucosaminyl deacetylase